MDPFRKYFVSGYVNIEKIVSAIILSLVIHLGLSVALLKTSQLPWHAMCKIVACVVT